MTINNMKKIAPILIENRVGSIRLFFKKYHQKECIIVLVNKAITVGSYNKLLYKVFSNCSGITAFQKFQMGPKMFGFFLLHGYQIKGFVIVNPRRMLIILI